MYQVREMEADNEIRELLPQHSFFIKQKKFKNFILKNNLRFSVNVPLSKFLKLLFVPQDPRQHTNTYVSSRVMFLSV